MIGSKVFSFSRKQSTGTEIRNIFKKFQIYPERDSFLSTINVEQTVI